MADPVETIENLLKDNWDSTNTDNKTPSFISIMDAKTISKSQSTDWIIVHRSTPNPQHAGVGGVGRHVNEKLNIDIRNFNDEVHWRKLILEVERILDVFQKNPDGGTYYDYLESMFQKQPLSDRMRKVFRIMWPVELRKYTEIRSTT